MTTHSDAVQLTPRLCAPLCDGQLCALMGGSVVPMAFVTVDDLTGSVTAATFSALFLALGECRAVSCAVLMGITGV